MKKIILALLTVAYVQFGCNRTSDILGPDACPSDAFAPIASLSVLDDASSTSTLNFVTSFTEITAAFNESITYKLTISAASGAIYVHEGKGSSLSLNWYGSATNGKYFKKDDALTITLTNICKTEPIGTATATISTVIGYNGFGFKVKNFEEAGAVSIYGDAGTVPYKGSNLITSDSASYVSSPQGGNYYKFKAKSVSTRSPNFTNGNGDNITWYFGGSDFFTTPPVQIASLGTDPTKVYLNFFAKGKSNSQAQFIITEIAHGNNLTRKVLANVGAEWTLYSVRLSDIGIINPSQITAFSFNLGAAQFQDTSAEVDLDLVIFTMDKPF